MPRSATALVVVHRADFVMSEAELAALLATVEVPALHPEDVAAFFDPARTAPGGFFEIFDAASRIWLAAGQISNPARARDAVDRTFLDPPGTTPAPLPTTTTNAAPTGLGFPSWLDRAAH